MVAMTDVTARDGTMAGWVLGPSEARPFLALAVVLVLLVTSTLAIEGHHRDEVRRSVYADMARLPPLPALPGAPLDLTHGLAASDPETADLAAACSTLGMRGYRWSRSGDVACADDRGALYAVP